MCWTCWLVALLKAIIQFFRDQYSRFLAPIVLFFGDQYSRFLQPIVENPILQFVWSIVDFIIPISVATIFFMFLLRPRNVVPRVDAAMITSFSLNNMTSTLDYDITVELSFHNRKYLDARYIDLTAVASYGGMRLGPTLDVLPVFVQRPNATNVVHAEFQGGAASLSPAASQVYEKEVGEGDFNVLVTVASTFMYDVFFKKVVYYYDHECYIRFPAPMPRSGGATVLTLGTLCNSVDQ